MSLHSYAVMCPRTKEKSVSGDVFIGVNTTNGNFILVVECDTCRERHHFPIKRLIKETEKILKEEDIKISS